jgi:hypothetical protein
VSCIKHIVLTSPSVLNTAYRQSQGLRLHGTVLPISVRPCDVALSDRNNPISCCYMTECAICALSKKFMNLNEVSWNWAMNMA